MEVIFAQSELGLLRVHIAVVVGWVEIVVTVSNFEDDLLVLVVGSNDRNWRQLSAVSCSWPMRKFFCNKLFELMYVKCHHFLMRYLVNWMVNPMFFKPSIPLNKPSSYFCNFAFEHILFLNIFSLANFLGVPLRSYHLYFDYKNKVKNIMQTNLDDFLNSEGRKT